MEACPGLRLRLLPPGIVPVAQKRVNAKGLTLSERRVCGSRLGQAASGREEDRLRGRSWVWFTCWRGQGWATGRVQPLLGRQQQGRVVTPRSGGRWAWAVLRCAACCVVCRPLAGPSALLLRWGEQPLHHWSKGKVKWVAGILWLAAKAKPQ